MAFISGLPTVLVLVLFFEFATDSLYCTHRSGSAVSCVWPDANAVDTRKREVEAGCVMCLFGCWLCVGVAHDAGADVSTLLLVAGCVPASSSVNADGIDNQDQTALQRFRAGLGKQSWLLNSLFYILRNRSNSGRYAALLQWSYGGNAKDQAVFESQPELLDLFWWPIVLSLKVSPQGVRLTTYVPTSAALSCRPERSLFEECLDELAQDD